MTRLRSTMMGVAGSLALSLAFVANAAPANALGLKDCSDKYSAAKAANKTGTKTFAEFQKTECGETTPVVTPAPAATTPPAKAATTAPATTPAVAPVKDDRAEKRKAARAAKAAAKAEAAKTATPAAPAAKTTTSTTAMFPPKINDAYKAKKPSKARMATCLDQYRANKATNANGGLKWIQKGGGYYSECNKRLKG